MRKAFSNILRSFESLILLFLSLFIRRRNDYIAIGSWGGKRYADNSRYLAEYIYSNCPNIKLFWVGEQCIKADVKKQLPLASFMKINTFSTNVKLLKCKYMFFSQMHNSDISSCNVYRKAITCYLHHGMPIKKWGQDGLSQSIGSNNLLSKTIHKLNGECIEYDYFVSSSPLHDITNCSALEYKGCCSNKIIHSGTPRNDMYFNVDSSRIFELKNSYSQQLKFDPSKRVVMYLPTYRRTETNIFSFSKLSDDQRSRIEKILIQNNCILIEKSHIAEKNDFDGISDKSIICAPSELNVQEMMMFADVLISDYSGAYLDYILLDRPVIHYAYDYEYYKNVDSGLYYDIEDFSAGFVAYDFDSLLSALGEELSGKDPYQQKRDYVRNKYMQYEDGSASSKIVSTVMGGNL